VGLREPAVASREMEIWTTLGAGSGLSLSLANERRQAGISFCHALFPFTRLAARSMDRKWMSTVSSTLRA
jgi:hypothetical protein